MKQIKNIVKVDKKSSAQLGNQHSIMSRSPRYMTALSSLSGRNVSMSTKFGNIATCIYRIIAIINIDKKFFVNNIKRRL